MVAFGLRRLSPLADSAGSHTAYVLLLHLCVVVLVEQIVAIVRHRH